MTRKALTYIIHWNCSIIFFWSAKIKLLGFSEINVAWLFVSSTRRPKPTANWPTNNDDVLHEIKILKTSIWQKYIIFHTYTYPQNPNPEMSTCLSWKLQHLHSVSFDIKWTIQNGGAANKLLCCSRAACNHEKQNGWIMKLAKVLEFNFSSPHIPCTPESILTFSFSGLPSHGAFMDLVMARCGIQALQTFL